MNALVERLQVYFAQDDLGSVKIGYSANVRSRIYELNNANSGKVQIIRLIDGGRPTERWLHRKFSSLKRKGEWFNFHESMMTVQPPDELPARKQVVVRRDVGLTVRERLHDAVKNGQGIGLSSKLILTTFAATLTNEEAQEILDLVAADAIERTALSGEERRSA